MSKLVIIGCGQIVEFAHVDAVKSLIDLIAAVALADTAPQRLNTVGRMREAVKKVIRRSN